VVGRPVHDEEDAPQAVPAPPPRRRCAAPTCATGARRVRNAVVLAVFLPGFGSPPASRTSPSCGTAPRACAGRGSSLVHLLDVPLDLRTDAVLRMGSKGRISKPARLFHRSLRHVRVGGRCLALLRLLRGGRSPPPVHLRLLLGSDFSSTGPWSACPRPWRAPDGSCARVDIHFLVRHGGIGGFGVWRIALALGLFGHKAHLGRGIPAAFKPAVANRWPQLGQAFASGFRVCRTCCRTYLASVQGYPGFRFAKASRSDFHR
jgi:hypothetical protein